MVKAENIRLLIQLVRNDLNSNISMVEHFNHQLGLNPEHRVEKEFSEEEMEDWIKKLKPLILQEKEILNDLLGSL